MAGDWTKMRNELPDDPGTVTIAVACSLDVDTVVGKLLRVWAWAGSHTVTGKCAGVTRAHVDHTARHVGFCAAMELAGWAEVDENGFVTFPKWSKHNGKAAKQRALAAERAARSRARSVTTSSRTKRTESAPREEKRRVLENPPKPPQGGAVVSKRQRGEQVSEDRLRAIAAEHGSKP